MLKEENGTDDILYRRKKFSEIKIRRNIAVNIIRSNAESIRRNNSGIGNRNFKKEIRSLDR
jgi:hypothetical protein